MQKKNTWSLVIVVIVIILVIIGFAIGHKSSKSKTTNSNRSQTSSINNSVVETKNSSSLGQYLTATNGKTLYTYGGDSLNTSNCSGSCIANWPAYEDTGSTSNLPANFGTTKRSDDGKLQYTFNGKPLYYFVGDIKAGEITGNGVSNFSVAKP